MHLFASAHPIHWHTPAGFRAAAMGSAIGGLTDVLGAVISLPQLASRPGRGRDASYLAPPAGIRTCTFDAYGSYLACLTANRLSGQG